MLFHAAKVTCLVSQQQALKLKLARRVLGICKDTRQPVAEVKSLELQQLMQLLQEFLLCRHLAVRPCSCWTQS